MRAQVLVVKSSEKLNKEIIETLQKIVHPKRLNNIYDRVIKHQTSQHELKRQEYVLGVIKEYIQEIDHHFRE
jgi:hypothetical protein